MQSRFIFLEKFDFVDVQVCFHDGLPSRKLKEFTPLSPFGPPSWLFSAAFAAWQSDAKTRLFRPSVRDFWGFWRRKNFMP